MDTKENVIEEKKDIDARIQHMAEQFDDKKFELIPGQEQERMNLQREFMKKYSETLQERIRLWDDESWAKIHEEKEE